jgi:TRAP-type C4-dicarboxylate transport system permease small subunit
MGFSRPLRRGLIAAVGLCLLAFYAVVAVAGYRLLALLWRARPDPETVVVLVGGLTLLSGYLSYRFGTARLLAGLDGGELEGILAHELAHLKSDDALVQTLAYSALRTLIGAALLCLFSFLLVVTGFAWAMAWVGGRPGAWASTPFGQLRHWVGQAVMGALSVLTLVLLARSRRRGFATDDRAASVTGNPLALARALRKIQRYSEPCGGCSRPVTTRTT